LRNAVVVLVNPKEKIREHGIIFVDDPVSVSAVFWFVEFR
jgi:hypothetical protein